MQLVEIKRVLDWELRRSESIGMETETRLEIVKVVWPEEEWQPLIREGGGGREWRRGWRSLTTGQQILIFAAISQRGELSAGRNGELALT